MNIEEEIISIKNRNKKVEAEKAWEVSWMRIGLISVITYFVAVVVMILIKVKSPLLSALIPTIGYLLSTQSVPVVKKWWINNRLRD